MISVITICRNASKEIRQTIESVLAQTSNEFEYIIKDGESTDDTLGVVNQYTNKFAEKDVRYHIVANSDDGIYSAMNQAALECTADWVIYLNAGDSFYGDSVIEELEKQIKNHISNRDESNASNPVKAIIGKTNYILHCGLNYVGTPRANSINDLDFCHQSVLVKKDYLLAHPFDETFKIVADRDQLLSIIRDLGPKSVFISDIIVSNYNTRGASQNDFKSTEAEAEELYRKYKIVHKQKSQKVALIKNIVARICPLLPDLMLVLKKSLK